MHIHNGLKIAQTLCNQSSPFPALIGISGAQIGIVQEIWATFVSRCVVVVTYFYFCEGIMLKTVYLFTACSFMHSIYPSTHLPPYTARNIFCASMCILISKHTGLRVPSIPRCCSSQPGVLQNSDHCACADKSPTEAMNEVFK